MKHPLTWMGILLIAVGVGAIAVRADAPWRSRWHDRRALGCLAAELGLTSAQKTQIGSIWKAEKPTVANLVAEFARENKEMQSLTAQGHPDPAKLQSVADLQGATLAALLVEKEKLKLQIENNVLTPDQRAKAEAFEKHMDEHIDRLADRLSH